MKQIIAKAQTLGKKAAELRQAVQSLPAHAAKIREAVTMTGSELHQLRAEVQTSIHSLKADSEERLLKTMREISDNAIVFEEVGYELTGMDLDLSLSQRLAVHLDRFEQVPHSAIRALHSRQSCESVRSILAAILKAEETAANVELAHLHHAGLVVHAGSAPIIRMLWRLADDQEQVEARTSTAAASSSVPAQIALAATPALGSMFEPRPIPEGAVRIVTHPTAEPEVQTAPPPPKPAPAPVSSAWSQSALDRFKTMPGASKYGR